MAKDGATDGDGVEEEDKETSPKDPHCKQQQEQQQYKWHWHNDS